MRVSQILSPLVLAACCAALPSHVPHRIHEKRNDGFTLWKRGQKVNGSAILPIRIGLTQSNLHNGYDHLMAV